MAKYSKLQDYNDAFEINKIIEEYTYMETEYKHILKTSEKQGNDKYLG